MGEIRAPGDPSGWGRGAVAQWRRQVLPHLAAVSQADKIDILQTARRAPSADAPRWDSRQLCDVAAEFVGRVVGQGVSGAGGRT